MTKLTLEQAIIITGYTGVLCCKFSDFQKDVEQRLEHCVFTHMFADVNFAKQLQDVYRQDFMQIIEDL